MRRIGAQETEQRQQIIHMGIRSVGETGVPVATHVVANHPVAARECQPLRVPHTQVEPETMNEHDGIAFAGDDVAQPSAVMRENHRFAAVGLSSWARRF